MSYCFDRTLRVEIVVALDENKTNTAKLLDVSELRVDFNIQNNEESNPNKSTIKIFNLSESNRDLITNDKYAVTVSVFAGYVENNSEFLIAKGDIDDILVKKMGAGTTTVLMIEDGKTEIDNAYFNKSYAKGVSKKKIIKDAVKSLKLDSLLTDARIDQILSILDGSDEKNTQGSTFSQKTKDFLNTYLPKIGISWSVQNGKVLLLGHEDVVSDDMYLLTPSTGLIGQPQKTIIKEKKKKGDKKESNLIGYDIQSLILPDVKIGYLLSIESFNFTGVVKIKSFTTSGSLFTNDWKMNIKTRVYNG